MTATRRREIGGGRAPSRIFVFPSIFSIPYILAPLLPMSTTFGRGLHFHPLELFGEDELDPSSRLGARAKMTFSRRTRESANRPGSARRTGPGSAGEIQPKLQLVISRPTGVGTAWDRFLIDRRSFAKTFDPPRAVIHTKKAVKSVKM